MKTPDTTPSNSIDFDQTVDYRAEAVLAGSPAEQPKHSMEQQEVMRQISQKPEEKPEIVEKIENLRSQLIKESESTSVVPNKTIESTVKPRAQSENKVSKGEAMFAFGATGATIALAAISVPAIATDLATGAFSSFRATAPALYLTTMIVVGAALSGRSLYQVGKKIFARESQNAGTQVVA